LSQKSFKIVIWKGLERSGKSYKNDKNEYKSSLGGRRQKLISALNSPSIGKKVELKRKKKLSVKV